ncbi:MAG: phosphorylase [Leptolyngbyaceae cyanobacterium T60_A2020_046]|nr:phosphorylase [Leptolyngbyaceae cyanobacterium T60_A2020_046]
MILVPAGAEYQAVCRGLRRGGEGQPVVQAIPAGQAVGAWLARRTFSGGVLVMGLGGSLQPGLAVGDRVLCETCQFLKPTDRAVYAGNATLHDWLRDRLELQRGVAVTSDRIVTEAAEKRAIAQRTGTQVIDMEGAIVFRQLQAQGVAIAMIRVISDDCHHNLPDMTGTIGPDGRLRGGAIAVRFLQSPQAAARLIRGSLMGLKQLEQTAIALFAA